VITVAALLLAAQAILAPGVCSSDLPANIGSGQFRRDLDRLLEQSGTFRQQCRRIAANRHVRITFGVARSVANGGRAMTVIDRFQAGAVVACVTLKFAEDYIELIPHELEHVIEQIDRVSLPLEEAARRAWQGQDGVFETRRAMAAGLRARREVDALAVEAVQADGRKPPALRHPNE
jgi:hypothetical protein